MKINLYIMTEQTVSTKEIDYLEEDTPIKNQNYCLLSFISPNDVLVNKEAYYLKAFLKTFSTDMETLFNGILTRFPDEKEMIENIKSDHNYLFNISDLDQHYKFKKELNSDEVEKEFHKDNNFQTSICGVKVRGVFDTYEHAKNRSEFLHKKDNIFIGTVGCWCPFNPNPNDLQDQEYSETQLNTLMKEYKKNQNDRDEIFEKRKQDAIINNTITEEDETTNDDITEIENGIGNVFTETDPWTQKKNEEKMKEVN